MAAPSCPKDRFLAVLGVYEQQVFVAPERQRKRAYRMGESDIYSGQCGRLPVFGNPYDSVSLIRSRRRVRIACELKILLCSWQTGRKGS